MRLENKLRAEHERVKKWLEEQGILIFIRMTFRVPACLLAGWVPGSRFKKI
jgi:hypothetical protein